MNFSIERNAGTLKRVVFFIIACVTSIASFTAHARMYQEDAYEYGMHELSGHGASGTSLLTIIIPIVIVSFIAYAINTKYPGFFSTTFGLILIGASLLSAFKWMTN